MTYDPGYIAIATARGYDPKAHEEALAGDPSATSDAVVLTHPFNWLTEDEVEDLARKAHDPRVRRGYCAHPEA